MVSPELLRRYPFFGPLTDEQLRAIAMLSDTITLEPGEELFREGEPASALYLLIQGGLDLHFVVADATNPNLRKDLFVAEINAGEPFGISALIEPHFYIATVRVTKPSQALKIGAQKLRALCEGNPALGMVLLRQAAKTAMARLHEVRVQLAAATSGRILGT